MRYKRPQRRLTNELFDYFVYDSLRAEPQKFFIFGQISTLFFLIKIKYFHEYQSDLNWLTRLSMQGQTPPPHFQNGSKTFHIDSE